MKRHDSFRGYFAFELHKKMKEDDRLVLITADLGYKVFDSFPLDYPSQFYNVGASEQAMIDIAIGMALSGKIPITYTITPFYLRAFEGLRTYLNYENIKIIMAGSGRGKDYEHDGFSHDASDIAMILDTLPKIAQFYPEDKKQIETVLEACILKDGPSFISLKK